MFHWTIQTTVHASTQYGVHYVSKVTANCSPYDVIRPPPHSQLVGWPLQGGWNGLLLQGGSGWW